LGKVLSPKNTSELDAEKAQGSGYAGAPMRAALWTPFALSRGTVASTGAKRGVICLLKKESMSTQGKKAFSLVVVIIIISITIIVYRYTDTFFRESMG
jgi:hypothetical protein